MAIKLKHAAIGKKGVITSLKLKKIKSSSKVELQGSFFVFLSSLLHQLKFGPLASSKLYHITKRTKCSCLISLILLIIPEMESDLYWQLLCDLLS